MVLFTLECAAVLAWHCHRGATAASDAERGDPEIGQPSYFLAETLKYLLLMFGPADRMQLDEVVFTTEGACVRPGGGVSSLLSNCEFRLLLV
jgi:hypothetical protein